jgi:hypothetical protein
MEYKGHAIERDCGQIGPDEFEMYSTVVDVTSETTIGEIVDAILIKKWGSMKREFYGMHIELAIDKPVKAEKEGK